MLRTDAGRRVGEGSPGTCIAERRNGRSNLELPRMRLHREMQAFLNGVPVALDVIPAAGTAAKTPFGLPPWATELPGALLRHGSRQ